ncbi:MAG: FAD-dependent oxidoreductase [Alphaproteobacteria bacterium]
MAEHNADIIIYGGGIAGLWTLNVLHQRGYDVLLLEKDALGGGQTLASQGIIHSGLKYMIGGKISDVAKQISAMPATWLDHLHTDFPAIKLAAASQQMLIPKGFAGALLKAITKNALGTHASESTPSEDVRKAGFDGSAITLNEPIIDVLSVLRALAEPHKDRIRKLQPELKAKLYIHAAAEGNERADVKIFRLPVFMIMMKNAPFSLFAHLIGMSDKPVATITTAHTKDGALVWYIGGQVSEREKNSNPDDVLKDVKAALCKYLPDLDLSAAEWAFLPVDRIEGRARNGTLPDFPVIQEVGDHLYVWPTKLTFAPLLGVMIVKKLAERNVTPSGAQTDWSFLAPVDYADAPWDKVTWKKDS